MPQVRAGKLKGLAVSSGKRAAFAPDLRTASEDGLPGYGVTGWYAFVAPAGMPASVLTKLNRGMTAILESAGVRERLLSMGAEPWPTSPAKAQAFIGEETVRWGKLIRHARITAD
jgi:tripartite-type tricarboxylate transporter receptor subunit TctC